MFQDPEQGFKKRRDNHRSSFFYDDLITEYSYQT